MFNRFRFAAMTLLAAQAAFAQQPASQPVDPAVKSTPPPVAPASQPTSMPSLIQTLPDYSGDWLTRRYLTGDWAGARTQLAQTGVLFDVDLTQWLQGNAAGGKDTTNALRYSGSADYTLRFDTARLGLWPGGLLTLHGETQIAQSINSKVGAIMAPNYQALLPVPGDPGLTTLSEFYFSQALSEKFVLTVGKVDLSSGDANEFAHDQRTQFSNLAFRINPALFNGGPYTTMAVSGLWLPTDWLHVTTFVCDNDPEGGATTTGFNTAFHGRDWLSVGQEYDFSWKPFGLPGNQRFGWLWTNRDFSVLESDSRLPLPVQTIGRTFLRRQFLPPWLRVLAVGNRIASLTQFDTRPDNWAIYYNFDQYVYTEADDPSQGWGVFGRFGLTPSEGNVIEKFYSLGLGGKGAIPTRDHDTWGLGYYLANMSDSLATVIDVHCEQGVELYYNIQITPWLRVTPDIQVIVDPGAGLGDRDPSIVYGLRAQMSF